MYVSGLTKSSCIADLDPTNCVCVKDLRSFALGSNEFVCVSGFTKLSTWIQDLRSYALGSNVFACVNGFTKLSTWTRIYEVKHLDPEFDLCGLESWVTCVTSVARCHIPTYDSEKDFCYMI